MGNVVVLCRYKGYCLEKKMSKSKRGKIYYRCKSNGTCNQKKEVSAVELGRILNGKAKL